MSDRIDAHAPWEHVSGYRLQGDGQAITYRHPGTGHEAYIDGSVNEEPDAPDFEYRPAIFDEGGDMVEYPPSISSKGHAIKVLEDWMQEYATDHFHRLLREAYDAGYERGSSGWADAREVLRETPPDLQMDVFGNGTEEMQPVSDQITAGEEYNAWLHDIAEEIGMDDEDDWGSHQSYGMVEDLAGAYEYGAFEALIGADPDPSNVLP